MLCTRLVLWPVEKVALDSISVNPQKLNVSKTAPTNSLKLLEGDPALLRQIAMKRAVIVFTCGCRVLLHPLAPGTII